MALHAQHALGDDEEDDGGVIVAPIEELVAALVQAIEAAESHLLGLGFDVCRLQGATGFDRIEALRDAVDALYTSDEALVGQQRRDRRHLTLLQKADISGPRSARIAPSRGRRIPGEMS